MPLQASDTVPALFLSGANAEDLVDVGQLAGLEEGASPDADRGVFRAGGEVVAVGAEGQGPDGRSVACLAEWDAAAFGVGTGP